ncbi:MAG: M20/M25/M40 family metallo-hydrolase [Oscillospiraceae bacterium]|nr:M20/M25/M40 family metallo-hydrolase [Oscillospiraceae bacterium]
MEQHIKQQIISARQDLFALAERSGQERQTQAYLKRFLTERTELSVIDRGSWLYARHDEGAMQTLVVRADHDAVPTACGAGHLCGHDGHTAALLGLALLLEGQRLGCNVILLFQHAEETGYGGAACCELFGLERLNRENTRIIGCHNIPGQALGQLLFRQGTFACASCGVEIRLTGSPTHAAYPENGVNPSGAVAELALKLPKLAAQTAEGHACMALATIVGMRSGEEAFGVAASDGVLWATLRAEKQEAFRALNEQVDLAAQLAAEAAALRLSIRRRDIFPATVNDAGLQDSLERACIQTGISYRYLDVPFRWSEDFGHYGSHVPACFFGIGAGAATPPLHTESYQYPDALAPITAETFYKLLTILANRQF